ncbi:MAG: hypothetical protein ETSY2_22560, partial [Candidatus Entotheonella gemina]
MQPATLDDRDDVSPSGPHGVWWVLMAAFLLRLTCMLIFGSHLYADEAEMGEIARNILAGQGFSLSLLGPEQPTAFIPPFEPYFFALIHGVFGDTPLSYAILIAIRSALSVTSAYVAYRIVRDTWSERLAILTLCTIAFYPPFIYYSAISEYLVRPPFSVLLCLLIVWCLLHFERHPSLGRACLTGGVFGFSLYVQSNFMSFIPFALAWMAYVLWCSREPLQGWRKLLPLVAMPLIAMLLLLPWTVRNYRAFGELVPLRTGFGLLFWLANNPVATGDLLSVSSWYVPRFDMAPAQTLSPPLLAQVRQANEVERDRLLLREATQFITSHPERYLQLTLIRLRSFWLGPPKHHKTAWKQIAVAAYGTYSVVLLGLALTALAFRRDRVVWLFVLLVIHFMLLYGLVQASYSYYRMDSEPFCLILAL